MIQSDFLEPSSRRRDQLEPVRISGQHYMSKMTAETKRNNKAATQFPGFSFPTTTPVPDQVFNELLSILTGAELKVLLYICRRTFGFRKDRDKISLDQLVNGIRKKNGKVLDSGTGLSRPTVIRSLNSLARKNVIIRKKNQSPKRGSEPTTFSLNILNLASRGRVESNNETRGVSKVNLGESHGRDPQQTTRQQTNIQQPALVASLMKYGLTQKTAGRLVDQHGEKRVAEKIDFLVFRLKETPGKIKSPGGWLRRAVEDDYDPPEGYRFPADREKEAAEKQKRSKSTKRNKANLSKAQAAASEERRKKDQETLIALQKQYGTTSSEREMWQDILDELKTEASGMTYASAKGVHLLTIDDETAVFAATNSFAVERIRENMATLLAEMFRKRGCEVHDMRAVILGESVQ